MIFIVSAAGLNQADLLLIRTLVGPENVRTLWFGEEVTTDISYDVHLPDERDIATGVEQAKELLHNTGVIFRPW